MNKICKPNRGKRWLAMVLAVVMIFGALHLPGLGVPLEAEAAASKEMQQAPAPGTLKNFPEQKADGKQKPISADDRYSFKETMPVQKFAAPARQGRTKELASMPQGALVSGDFQFTLVPASNQNGFYYYNNGAIRFYGFEDDSCKAIIDYDTGDRTIQNNMISVFATESKIYTLYISRKYEDKQYVSYYYLDIFDCEAGRLADTKDLTAFAEKYANITAVGVDGSGRYYFGVEYETEEEMRYGVVLATSGFQVLSSVKCKETIYDFRGFDSINGNFYYEGFINYYSWGYDHYCNCLRVGNVTGNKIVLEEAILDLLYQRGFYDHIDSVDMLDSRYLAWTSTLSGTVCVIDSHSFALSDETLPVVLGIDREGFEKTYDESVGTRTLYNKGNGTFLMYINDNTIAELTKNGDTRTTYKTEHIVFGMYQYGDRILVIERDDDGNYYYELLRWSAPESINVSPGSSQMTVGETLQVEASYISDLALEIKWASSNNTVASVDGKGKVYANKPGTAVITASLDNGVSAKCTVTVSKAALSDKKSSSVKLKGKKSDNELCNVYGTWSSVMDSYLYENSDKTMTRVENTKSGVLVEKYSADGKTLLSTKTIKKELALFGGFFSGKQYNYLVFGQSNKSESDAKEVVRVVKYTKGWSRVSACSIKGANTYIPFDAGCLRMMENDGRLYVYTCHEMYDIGDGLHHQANMLFTINISDMKVVDSMYDISNLSEGYVSHSFNQFIRTDGDYIYRVDHAEGGNDEFDGMMLSTKGIVISKYHKDKASTEVAFRELVHFDLADAYGNYTGASIGGFEMGSNHCLVAYNYDISKSCDNRNVYVSIVDDQLKKPKKIALTSYKKSSNVTCFTPQLVKINENLFLVLWMEKNTKTEKKTAMMMTMDARGNIISKKNSGNFSLSDCQPVLFSDGLVKWYVTDGSNVTLYSLNPYNLSSLHKHSYKTVVTKPTYFKKGHTTYTCAFCGHSYTGSYTNKLRLAAPKKFKMKSNTSTTITLTWNKTKKAKGYVVEQYRKGKWKKVKQLAKNKLVVKKLTPGKKYKFRVRAFIKSGAKCAYGSYAPAIKAGTKSKRK